MKLVFALLKIIDSNLPDRMERFVNGAWALSKDYPNRANGYQCIMMAITDYPFLGKPDRARALAQELIDSSAPDTFKLWAKGFLYRMDSIGKPVTLKFTAVDGGEVDLKKMKGKVVLVYFWESDQEFPKVKAAYDKFHGQGFEVIGIYCYTDKERMNQFLKENDLPWPQYFDGQNGKFTQEFGIDGIPHLLLVDKKSCLRFDDVDVRTGSDFENKVAKLLSE